MNSENKMNCIKLRSAIAHSTQPSPEEKSVLGYRFDIFKGAPDENGKIIKVKSLGSAYLKEGQRTYSVNLKTFLNQPFYLLPNSKPELPADYVILTREDAKHISRKYFWNNIGEGFILDGINHGVMKLTWDLLVDNIYMCLHPISGREPVVVDCEAAA
jgi:hypothetical protein